jgi:hypothetical protein
MSEFEELTTKAMALPAEYRAELAELLILTTPFILDIIVTAL